MAAPSDLFSDITRLCVSHSCALKMATDLTDMSIILIISGYSDTPALENSQEVLDHANKKRLASEKLEDALTDLYFTFYLKVYIVHVYRLLFLFNPFPHKPWFLHVCNTRLLKTLRKKKKLLVMSNFSFSHSVFYPFAELSSISHQIQNFGLQTPSVWKSLKFVKICHLGKGLTLAKLIVLSACRLVGPTYTCLDDN